MKTDNLVTIALLAGGLYLGYSALKKSGQTIDNVLGAPGKLLQDSFKAADEVIHGASSGVDTVLNRARGEAMVTAFNATGYDITAPHVVADFIANTAQGVKPNFETATGHQIYVAAPAFTSNQIAPVSAPTNTHPLSSTNSSSTHPTSGSGASSVPFAGFGSGYSYYVNRYSPNMSSIRADVASGASRNWSVIR